MFPKIENANRTLLAMSVVDTVLIIGTYNALRSFIDGSSSHFKLGKVVHGPGILRFHDLIILQSDGFSDIIYAVGNL